MSDARPVVGVYIEHYLTASMTFIHRQLEAASREFRPVVLTQSTAHLNLFPFEPIHVHGRGRLEDLATRGLARITGRSTMLSGGQRRRFAAILRREGASLIHAHFGPSALQILPVARSLDLPLLVHFHGYDASSLLRDPAYRSDLARLFSWPKVHVVAVSRAMALRLAEHGAPGSRTRILYYGIPTSRFPLVERTPPREKARLGETLLVLQACNFVEKKGHETTVRAFARIAEKRQDVRLVLAGDGPLRQRIEALASELGLSSRVTFPGIVNIDGIAALLREADVFVHPSVTAADGDQEGIPNVIMEAMATGLPVVSTLHAGIPELVEDGVSGLLVPERDVGALEAALLRALTQGPEMGLNASRRVAQSFDLDGQAEGLKAIYREVLDSR